jgi:hypothetical protein
MIEELEPLEEVSSPRFQASGAPELGHG